MAKTYRQVILNTTHLDAASKRVEKSKIFKYSHRKREANQVGYLGEVVFEEFLKKNKIKFIDDRQKTTHDYFIGDSLTHLTGGNYWGVNTKSDIARSIKELPSNFYRDFDGGVVNHISKNLKRNDGYPNNFFELQW